MASVSVAEAKDRFADLIRRAEAGESVIITRRGKPVVRMLPTMDDQDAGRRELHERIRRVREGMATQPDSLPLIRGMRGHEDGEPWS